jgi:hypothetical protein
MKLDDIEKLIAAATPGPWPKEYGHCDFPDYGLMACGPIITGYDEEADENQAQDDQDFICIARELMPKLLKVVRAVQGIEFVVLRLHAEGGNDSFESSASVSIAKMNNILTALTELEQP